MNYKIFKSINRMSGHYSPICFFVMVLLKIVSEHRLQSITICCKLY